jgi:small-conductance mechanosensitive channel
MNSFVSYWQKILSSAIEWLSLHAQQIYFGVLLFSFFYLLSQLFKLYSHRTFDIDLYKRPTPEALVRYNKDRRKLIVGRAFWLLFVTAAFVSIPLAAGVNAFAVFGAVGSIMIALSFAIGPIIQQFVSGFLLLTQRPINIGEQVSVNGQRGVIKAIELRYTILRDYRERDIVISNTDMLANMIIVEPVEGMIRDLIQFRMERGSDLPKTLQVGAAALLQTPGVDKHVAPRGYVRDAGNEVLVSFYFSCPAARREHFVIRSEAIQNVLKSLETAGLKIKYSVNTVTSIDLEV